MDRQDTLRDIARRVLGIPTLETVRSDERDFHEFAVWSVRQAVEAAYEAGVEAERRGALARPTGKDAFSS